MHGMQEVAGSIPASSTKILWAEVTALHFYPSPSSRGLGHRPFTAVTGVRIPLGTPNKETGHIVPRFFVWLLCSSKRDESPCGLDNFAGSEIGRPKAGPSHEVARVSHMDVANNLLGAPFAYAPKRYVAHFS